MPDFQTLHDRAMTDVNFRRSLVADPAGTLASVGIEPTTEVLCALKEAMDAFIALGAKLSPGLDVPENIS
jgi:hypothetical protein